MASGTGLIPYTSLVLVENPEWGRQPDRTQTLHAFRQTYPATGGAALTGVMASGSLLYGNLFGSPPPQGTSLVPINQVVLVENPEWVRQPDRTSQLFALLPSQSPIITQVVQGYIPAPMGRSGAGSVLGDSLFFLPPLSFTPPTFVVPMAGLSISGSVFSALLTLVPPRIGFIPQPGPGLGSPFNPNQFVPQPGDTFKSSGTILSLSGLINSGSVIYGEMVGAGALGGTLPVTSLLFGPATAIPIGTMSGVSSSGSVAYGSLQGDLQLSGLLVSGSVFTVQQIGGAFVPLVPMTAVTDVRLNIGYQPWRVHRDDVIG